MPGSKSNDPLGSSWFGKTALAKPADVESDDVEPDAEDAPAPSELEGDPKWALAFGALSGGAGAAAMIFVAAEISRRRGIDIDVIRTIGRGGRVLSDDAFVIGIAVAVVVGIFVGMLFGALMRHARRPLARVLAGMLLAVGLWTLVHAFVLKSFAPTSLGNLPFGPMIAGASLFGLCVAILRPPARRI